MSSRLKALLPYLLSEPVSLSLAEKSRTATAAFAAVLLLGMASAPFLSGTALPIMVASMGASAVLMFALPHSPLAQPWPFAGGHVVSALVGVTSAQWVPDPVWAAALAVGGSLFAMHMLHCLHPPGGAAALVPVLGGAQVQELGYGFVLTPLAVNLTGMLLFAVAINKLLLRRDYPPRPARDAVRQDRDPDPLSRVGISRDDLHHALEGLDEYIDVSEQDLGALFRAASAHSYRRRLGEITCRDIMSRGMVSVEYGTELEEAWALLRLHKVKSLPVLDPARRVIGIVTLVDFLKRADLKSYETFAERLVRLIRRTPGLESEKPEVVGQIMASPVVTVPEDRHIVELVPLLSARGLHRIPVVDAEQRLVGMVTQSDLIAALFGEPIERRPPEHSRARSEKKPARRGSRRAGLASSGPESRPSTASRR